MCAMGTTGGANSTELQLFGGLRVQRADGHVVDLGSRKQRMVLLALALRPNDLVTTDELIERLWVDSPPKAALTSLRSYLSNLRKALSDASIDDIGVVTRSPGYVLEIDPEQIDLTRFRRDAGAHEVTGLDRALQLADRAIVPEFATEEMTQPLLRDIEQEIFDLRCRRIETALEAGEHVERLGELARLVEARPLDERLRSLHMLALYRAGRQVDALATYAEAREHLLEDLGLDPSPELQDLERRVLEQDPGLLVEPQPRSSTQPRTETPPEPKQVEPRPHRQTIGRSDAMAVLLDAANNARSGHGQIVVVRGAAGLGKSHLVAALTERLDLATIAWGRCSDAEGVPALWPWLEVSERLDVSSAGLDADAGGDALLQFTRDLSTTIQDVGPDEVSVVIIEDMHWIDERSALLLRHLAGRIEEIGALLVVTSREIADGPLATLLSDLDRLPDASTVELQPLTSPQVHELVEASLDESFDLSTLDRLAERSGGNPLFALQLARAGSGRRDEPLPRDLAHAFKQQVGDLEAVDRKLFEIAACCTGTIDPDLMASLTDRDVDDVIEQLEKATERGFVRYDDADPTLYRFAHVLLRDALYDSVSPRTRARRHAEIGRALAEDPREVGGDGAELARHFGLGASAGVAAEALHWNHEAGRRALGRADQPNALLLLRRATELADKAAEDPLTRADILRSRGVAARNQAEIDEAKNCLLESFRLSAGADDLARMAAAALELSDGTGSSRMRMWWRLGELPLEALKETLERLEAADGDPLLTLEIRAVLAADDLSRPLEERAEQIDAITAEAKDLGDVELELRIEILRQLLWARLLAPQESLEQLDKAVELARTNRLVEAEFLLRRLTIIPAMEAGDSADVERRLAEARSRADLLGLSAVTDPTRLTRAMWLTTLGAIDEAVEEYAREMREVEALGPFAVQNMVLGTITAAFWRDGDGDFAQAATTALDPDGPPQHLVAGLSMFATMIDEMSLARGSLDLVDFDKLIAPENLMVGDLTLACAGMALADVGSDDECQQAYDALLPLAGRLTSAGPALLPGAQADTGLARLARRLGRLDDARRHVNDALDLTTSLGAHLLHQLARSAQIEIDVAAGETARAREGLEQLERAAHDRGLKSVGRVVERLQALLH